MSRYKDRKRGRMERTITKTTITSTTKTTMTILITTTTISTRPTTKVEEG